MKLYRHLAIVYLGANMTVRSGMYFPAMLSLPSGTSLPDLVGTGGQSRKVSMMTLFNTGSFNTAGKSRMEGNV